ncbi:MAG: XrtN system VIT domain-containing protein [Bacteroidota bacterium]
MNASSNPIPQPRGLILGGLIAVFLSLAIFHASTVFGNGFVGGLDGFFIANFAIAVGYWLVAAIHSGAQHGLRRFFILNPTVSRIAIILFSIGAFSLDQSFQLVGATPIWFGAALHIAFGALFLDSFYPHLHPMIQNINNFCCGIGLAITAYFSLLMLPVLPFAVIGLIFFGISVVAFAPLFGMLAFAQIALRRKARRAQISFFSGLLLPLLLLAGYMVQYHIVQRDLERVVSTFSKTGSDLPVEIFAAQFLPVRAFRNHALTSPKRELLTWDNFGAPTGSGYNDPFSILGRGLSGDMPLNERQRKRLIAAQTDLRHASQRRLWDDDHLLTREVHTEIEVYPEFRLAYVEKTFKIEHFGVKRQRGRWREEAVYTIHLPEGAVATSLSLWVNGKERKARFTSKDEADRAYTTIVGREARDPALLHWQEGNTLVVTVFPVQPDLPRKFKLGMTVPLRAQGPDLVLENIVFEGPIQHFTREMTTIRFIGEVPQSVELPEHFTAENPTLWMYEGGYRPAWKLHCAAPDLSPVPFTFQGKSYRAFPYRPEMAVRNITDVYLDLNASWTEDEFAQVCRAVGDRRVWTFDRGMKRLGKANRHLIFAAAQEARFSLFPLYAIPDPEHALVISKPGANYVGLEDLRHSPFHRKMEALLDSAPVPIAYFNLGGHPGPYFESLRQFGVLNYQAGSTAQLGTWLNQGRFPAFRTEPGKVILPSAGMEIYQSDADEAPATNPAPDHLLRLYAYNKCLETAGKAFLRDHEFSGAARRLAEEAYVVSPFTSLIVLETDADYERFGIEESENSLGNSTLHGLADGGTGSVPEPHEWLLIGLVLAVLVYTQRKRLHLV